MYSIYNTVYVQYIYSVCTVLELPVSVRIDFALASSLPYSWEASRNADTVFTCSLDR